MRKLNNKFLFVSFEPGVNGHKLARVLAAEPCIHWFSSPENGTNSWNISSSENKYKFNAKTPQGILPPTHDAVEKYMPNEKQYYKLFDELFAKSGGPEILESGKRIMYCTHSMPAKILEYFPNSLIWNIVHDPDDATNNCIEEMKNTPAYNTHQGLVPKDNEYLAFLRILHKRKPDLSVADVWSFERKKKFFEPKMEEKLRKEIYAKMFSSKIFRKAVDNKRVFNVDPENTDYADIKKWFSDNQDWELNQ